MVRTRCLLALGLLVGACGGPDEPPAKMGRLDASTARSSVVGALELGTALQAMNVDLVASALFALHGAAWSIVLPDDAQRAALVDRTTAVEHQSLSSSCDATGCRFMNYPFTGTDSTLDGDIRIAPATGDRRHLTWLLTVQAPGGNGSGTFIFERWGDIVLSASHLSGELRTTQAQNDPRMTLGLESRARYSEVTIAEAAATSGTVYARFKTFNSAGNISSAEIWDGTVDFAR
jgi:hypothetical protein